jgi:hypothetical protein
MGRVPRYRPTKHHRKPRSIGGGNEPRNISMVPCYQHEAWHAIVLNHTAFTIQYMLNDKYLDPDYKFICVKSVNFFKALDLVRQL